VKVLNDPEARVYRALIAEDESYLLDLLESYLTHRNFIVSKASDYREACSIMNQKHFDILITDIALDGNDFGGIELLKVAKSQGIPNLIISGQATMLSLKAAINLRADYFMEKPFDLDIFYRVVMGLIKQQHSMGYSKLKLQVGN